MGKGYRAERMGEEIRKVVSNLLLRELKDPRFSGIVSISAVEVTADFSYATLYVSVLDETDTNKLSEDRKKEILEAFKGAKGLIRREISKRVKTRHVPDIIFKIDTSLEYGRRISQVIAELDTGRKDKDE